MKRSEKAVSVLSVGSLGLAVVALFGVAVAGSVVPPATAATVDKSATEELAEVSQEFTRPQSVQDQLPKFLQGERALPDLAPATSRYLGLKGDASFYLAGDVEGNVCLVLVRSDEWTAQSCLPPADVVEGGLAVALIDLDARDAGTRAYLLPEGFKSRTLDTGTALVGDQLLVGPANVDGELIQAVDSKGNSIEVAPLEAIEE